jgi:hypothetical protein
MVWYEKENYEKEWYILEFLFLTLFDERTSPLVLVLTLAYVTSCDP